MSTARLPRILTTSIASLLTVGTALAVDVTVNNQTLIGHSIYEYSGTTQGVNNWEYGFYNLTADGNATYETGDFQYLNQGGWTNWSISGPPPWTAIIGPTEGHPNGTNNISEMWAIRRYTVQPGEGGSVDVNWFLRKSGAGDTGTAAEVFVNGISQDTGSVGGADTTGFIKTKTVAANAGDKIDIVLKPNGVDFSDSSHFGMVLQKNQIANYTGLTLLADSALDFSGVQGQDGWRYGYYNVSVNGQPDLGGTDFIEFPGAFWNGTFWNWTPGGDPPWTEVTNVGGHPNGTNNGDEHWATRRYVVQPGEAGDLFIEWSLAKGNPSGDGTTVRIFRNGVQIDASAVEGVDTTGLHRGFVINGAQVGDVIDIALSPQGAQDFYGLGGALANDGADGSLFGAKVYTVPEPGAVGVLLAAGAWLVGRRRRS